MTTTAEDALYMGLDASTQGLQATLIDSELNILHEASVNFDNALPEFKTEGGVHRHADGLTVTSPAIMWVAALDLLLERIRSDGWPLARVVALSGSGQQHGSVWLRSGTRKKLEGLAAGRTLREQLADIFSVPDSPVWMDSSTTAQCREREAALGGAQAVADLTGSRAYERFTGNQIAKIGRVSPQAYTDTHRIALVSSFMASLLTGTYAPIDFSDGSGMNLMNIRSKQWAPAALDCTAVGLADKLGDLVASHGVVGLLHAYYRERFGFAAECRVVAFSGDNPNSLAGLILRQVGDAAISLGTSDTLFGSLAEPKPCASEGHIFVNPVEPQAYMALICYKNGSLTREHVRDTVAGGSWETFDNLLQATEPGNAGNIGFYFKEPEITPPVLNPGIFRFDGGGRAVDVFPPGTEVRAVVEGQFLSMRLHGANVGLEPVRVLATGGASANQNILRVLADVFGVPVSVPARPGSAALGAAYRALHGLACEKADRFAPFDQVLAAAPGPARTINPDSGAHALYEQMLGRYREFEERVCGGPGTGKDGDDGDH